MYFRGYYIKCMELADKSKILKEIMKITTTNIEGLIVFELNSFGDDRGYFKELYKKSVYKDVGIEAEFVQDNLSKSIKNVVRGLHYQSGQYAQGKLVSVIKGKVLDVAVDIRFGSPTYGKYYSLELSEENKKQFWIPPGFAHGFSVLSDEAYFLYKCTAEYSKEHEKCIIYNDPELNIDWKVDTHLVSPKDFQGVLFKNIDKDFNFKGVKK